MLDAPGGSGGAGKLADRVFGEGADRGSSLLDRDPTPQESRVLCRNCRHLTRNAGRDRKPDQLRIVLSKHLIATAHNLSTGIYRDPQDDQVHE